MGRLTLYRLLMVGCFTSCTYHPQPVTSLQNNIDIKGGEVTMFHQPGFDVHIPALEVQATEVTNEAFKKFIDSTGYITTVEKTGEGMVFDREKKKWILKKGADWKHPKGPGSGIGNKKDHPVVQVSYTDACAYCEWLDMRLPYESEWEYIFYLDSQKPAVGSNHWQGVFPYEDKGTDGYTSTSPVGRFGAGYSGCYDLQGNVWEWCMDYYHEQWPLIGSELPDTIQYKGPYAPFAEKNMYDTTRVIKGGSFLCADNYCQGYMNKIRMGADPHLGYQHTGFRCVKKQK